MYLAAESAGSLASGSMNVATVPENAFPSTAWTATACAAMGNSSDCGVTNPSSPKKVELPGLSAPLTNLTVPWSGSVTVKVLSGPSYPVLVVLKGQPGAFGVMLAAQIPSPSKPKAFDVDVSGRAVTTKLDLLSTPTSVSSTPS